MHIHPFAISYFSPENSLQHVKMDTLMWYYSSCKMELIQTVKMRYVQRNK